MYTIQTKSVRHHLTCVRLGVRRNPFRRFICAMGIQFALLPLRVRLFNPFGSQDAR